MRWRYLPWLAALLVMGAVAPALVQADGPSEPRGEALRPHRAGPERTGPGSRAYRDSLPRDERKRLRRMEVEERRAEMRGRVESMSPEERRALRLGRRERERGPGRRPHAGWKPDIEALAPGEREALHEQMRGLSPEERRDVLRDRFGDPKPPPPGEMGPGSDSRRRVGEYLDSLPEDERQQLRSELEGLKPRERRKVMRDRFRNLPAEEQHRGEQDQSARPREEHRQDGEGRGAPRGAEDSETERHEGEGGGEEVTKSTHVYGVPAVHRGIGLRPAERSRSVAGRPELGAGRQPGDARTLVTCKESGHERSTRCRSGQGVTFPPRTTP